MQFVEKNSFNLRTVIRHLKNDKNAVEFLLFPMIHVGTKEFFENVSQRLARCDLVLAEGVDSRRAVLLTLSYRIIKKIRRMDLVTQQEAMKVSLFSDKIMKADINGKVFDKDWSSLPLALRLQIFLFLPVYVVYLFFFGTREMIAENLALDDLPTADEIIWQDENTEKLDALLIDERDKKIIQEIEVLCNANYTERKLVGVVYGAMHMRNVTNFLLDKRNYKITDSEWLVIFDL